MNHSIKGLLDSIMNRYKNELEGKKSKGVVLYLLVLLYIMVPCLMSAPVELVSEKPITIKSIGENSYLVDFGKVTFGNLKFHANEAEQKNVVIHFGEDFKNNRINKKPEGSVRYNKTQIDISSKGQAIAAPPADKRNTRVDRNVVHTPKAWGVVLPFRWVEVEGWKGDFTKENIVRQSAYLSAWDDDASHFECSDALLNSIWTLCKDSIKATTFAGVYVDGDRERIPYEADAYLNQLSHYYTDNDIKMARDTYDYLMKYPTWPTEWASHMVFMAHADWMRNGDAEWLRKRYDQLQSKLLLTRLTEKGLVKSNKRQIAKGDIVDWPKEERDGFVFTKCNSVVCAFQIHSLYLMADIAGAIGATDDAKIWREKADKGKKSFNAIFLTTDGIYVDGVGAAHSSLHANLFPLAFGIVPKENQEKVIKLIVDKKMRCSVYVAQYLLEALYKNGQDKVCYELMTADNDRSWRHMVKSGATITWEAWDMKYKPNQDWNHAWGAAPANILPRFVLGVESIEPNWAVTQIKPQFSGLSWAKGKVPTSYGGISIEWKKNTNITIKIIPAKKATCLIILPDNNFSGVFEGGKRRVEFVKNGGFWVGTIVLEGQTILALK